MNKYSGYRGNNYSQNRSQQRTINKDFYNPYAFVPLTNRVYLLDQQEQEVLSHDMPFQNGHSGTISIDFESLTPFCVCGDGKDHTNMLGRFFVPATSIKGMIRSVFEIITMSNTRNGIANKRYSMRDLRNRSYELKSPNHPQKSGFLIQINGKFYINECSCEKVTYAEIEEEERVSELKKCNSLTKKYEKLQSPIIEYQDGSFAMWFFSGFMNNKKHEYLFDIPQDFKNLIPLKEPEYKDFIFIHEKENDNASWKFWKSKLKNYRSVEDVKNDKYKGVVPCFFRTKTDEEGKLCVKDLGFSFLYRQPYKKTIHDFLPSAYRQEGIDMAQSVFGYVNRSNALKGRLQFEHSFIENARKEKEQTFILGSPKPTYYPFYLKQDKPGELLTYFDQTCLSGQKRYLVQQNAVEGKETPSKVTKTFVPLSANTKFTAKIHFHNLRDYELGALIAAITFCNQQTSCFHSLGIAKPYGYGKLRVNSWSVNLDGEDNQKDFYQEFISVICEKLKFGSERDYLKSISSLFEIASAHYNPQKPVRYPRMNDKEFDTIKNMKLSLKDFTPNKL